MKRIPRFVLATASIYSLMGVVGYVQTVLLPCRDIFSFLPVLAMLVVGPLTYLVSTGRVAIRFGERWVAGTIANAAAALVLGTILARFVYAGLARLGPDCGVVHLCAGCFGSSGLQGIAEAMLPALIGSALAPGVGWVARRLT